MPAIAWMVLIFLASTNALSAEHTSRFLVPFLRWLKPDISSETLAQIQFLVRKFGHVTEYAILATLLWRALRGGTNLRMQMSTVFVAVWLACGIFATSDEFHQSFMPSRTAVSSDVLIDICGATIGLAICLMVSRKHNSAAPLSVG
jgi:VanZ family protein